MPTRKIRDLVTVNYCTSPEHNPPSLISLPPGVYEHTCPLCRHKQTFIVRSQSHLSLKVGV